MEIGKEYIQSSPKLGLKLRHMTKMCGEQESRETLPHTSSLPMQVPIKSPF